MSEIELNGAVDERAKTLLGAGWETGGVDEIDSNSYMCPRPIGDERVKVTVLWATEDSALVATGEGSVISAGEVNGWALDGAVGTLDEVIEKLATEVARLLRRGRRRWWQMRS